MLAPAPVQWQNRIVAYHPAYPLDQLTPHPRNPKIHPRAQTEALKGILGEVGWVLPLLQNLTTGYTLDGHDRMVGAGEAQQRTAPVIDIAVSEAEELYILSTLDPVGALAGQDAALLADLLAEVQTGDAAVQALLDGLAGTPIDPAALWQGMPEFEQPDVQSWKQLLVHFENETDYEAFCRLVGQALTLKTKSMWYPPRAHQTNTAQVYDES